MQYNIWLDENKFTYELLDNSVANTWAEFMKDADLDSLRPNLDPWHGLPNLTEKIQEFNAVIENINQWIPEKINLFDADDPEHSLNSLHINFPKQERIEQDNTRLEQLRNFNDLLHQIDLGLRSKGQRIFLLLCPDLGRSRSIEDSEYEFFQAGWRFGDLLLHYPHVGRHPFEIYTTNDRDVPSNQIVCQNKISALHTLRFFDAHINKTDFKNFYQSSGIVWPYEFSDPKLAFGYIKLGTLTFVNNQKLSRQEILNTVKSSKKITKWHFDQNFDRPDDLV